MTERDRLIELLNGKSLDTADDIEYVADCLIANGVILPPVKVSDTVYVINSLWVSEYTVNEIAWDSVFWRCYCDNPEYAVECRNFMFFDERIGKTVFLTREKAEQALKERSDHP